MTEPLVSALVSTYASERYLRGCLDSLLAQTLRDRLEIIVVDACSPEAEGAIVREYQRRFPRLRYVRTAARECSSRSLARATELAKGRYLTTANADDRHRPDFAATMVAALERASGAGIAYADSLITERDNETWAVNTATRRYAWPDYTPTAVVSCCLFGAQPMWRRAVHATVGSWDAAWRHANDQDLFGRIALRFGAVHVREPLGLFLKRPDSNSGADNRSATLREVLAVMRRLRTTTPLEVLFPGLAAQPDDTAARAAALVELGNLCALGPYTDAELALDCYRRAAALPLDGAAAAAVRAAFANNCACILAAAGARDAALRAWRHGAPSPTAAANLARLGPAAPRLRELQFVEVDHEVVRDSRTARALVLDGAGELGWSAPHEQRPWQVFEGPDGVPLARAARVSRSLPGVLPAVPPRAPAASRAASPVATPGPAGARCPADAVGAPRVLMVMYGWADSGGGTMLPRAFAQHLARSGQAVAVFYAAAQPEPSLPAYGLRRHTEDGVELVGVCNRPSAFMDLLAPGREIDDPRVREAFAAELERWRPDVVHFWNLHNLGMSLPGECRARGIPTVLSSNNYWSICPRLYLVSERLERCDGPTEDGSRCERCLGAPGLAQGYAARRREGVRMLRLDIDVHLAVSERVRELHVRNGDDAGHVRVLRQEPAALAAIWERTGARRVLVDALQRPLRVGFFGSVMAHKGVHVLAQALQRLPAGAVEAVALGDVAADYREALRRFDPAGRLHLAGPYDPQQLPSLLAAVDVVVVPSVWDDCAPFVVAEALAARCPVVGSRIGGIPDFVAHGRNGLLFPAGDAEALAQCLLAFAHEPGLLGRLQRAIAPPRGLAAFAADVAKVYAELLAAKAPLLQPVAR